MSRATDRQLHCADCGNKITGDPVRLSAAESLCEDCWPFLLSPLSQEEPNSRTDGSDFEPGDKTHPSNPIDSGRR